MSFKIGQVALENNLILAPMAGVTDLPFRLLCKAQGCGLMYTEMVSAKAIMYNNKNTEPLLKIDEQERPVALQLFGNDPKIMSEQAKRIESLNFDILDINMGCPVPKIVNNGEGSALMKNPRLAGEIVSAISKAIQKPVTAKIRKGFDEDHVNAVEMAKVLEDAGAAAIAVHGRTRAQYYSGQADWDIIAKVKDALSIPVIGNGDLTQPEDGAKMQAYTGCDGLMIGRGVQGNPWLFSRMKTYMETGICPPKPSIQEVIDLIMVHAKMQIEFKGDYLGMREMRKHVAWYTAGCPDSAKLRNQVNHVETITELEELFKSYADLQGL